MNKHHQEYARDQDETRDPCLQDWDVQNFIRDETKTKRCSFRDAGRDLEAPKILESLRSFKVSPRRFPWHMVKHIDNGKNYT